MERAFKNVITDPIDYTDLTNSVRLGVVSDDASRRLSCWSTAHAYFVSAMTGEKFCSKNFQNAVNQNDLGKLYDDGLKVFDIFGEEQTNAASRFVGYSSPRNFRCNESDVRALVRSIFSNISEENNLSADGTRTVGFIEGAYHRANSGPIAQYFGNCSHQFNFELLKPINGVRELFITDGYAGKRWHVATQDSSGAIKWIDSTLSQVTEEMHSYNSDSVRFYAPSTKGLNYDLLSKVVLEKTHEASSSNNSWAQTLNTLGRTASNARSQDNWNNTLQQIGRAAVDSVFSKTERSGTLYEEVKDTVQVSMSGYSLFDRSEVDTDRLKSFATSLARSLRTHLSEFE